MLLFQFIELVTNTERLVDFLTDHGVLLSQINCGKCGNVLYLNKKTLMYHCHKLQVKRIAKKKPISKQCNYRKSARTGSWFARSNLDIAVICKLVACFLFFRHPKQQDTMEELNLSSRTVVDCWFNFCREVCVFWAEKNSQKLGGPEHIVEIDEAKIGHRKYNRGRFIQGQWIFGGYERGSKKVFIMPVEDRSEETLLACIKEWVLPGTTIISDCWKSYNCLNSKGFQHLTINHSYNFVDPQTDNIQHIERVWKDVQGNIPRYGTRSYHALGYLAEFLFKRAYSREEMIDAFFTAISEMMNPLMSAATSSLESSVLVDSEEEIGIMNF